jgi:ribokinase
MRVVVVGSSNTDLVVHSARLPVPGETILGGAFRQSHGGKGANQAVAAARAGAQVTFIGARGRDALGGNARSALRAAGVDTRYFVAKPDLPSGVALIMVGGKTGENLIAVAKSANDALTVEDVRAAERAIRRADVLIAQLEVPLETVIEAATIGAKYGVPFVLNPAPARPLPGSLLRMVHTIVPNEEEAAQLAGKTARKAAQHADLPATFRQRHPSAAGSAQSLLRKGVRNVVITLGAHGALVANAAGMHSVRAPRVKPLDTVGAGDCFTAWLALGIAEGLPILTSAERAAHAAAIAVTRAGAQAGMPFREEVPGGL